MLPEAEMITDRPESNMVAVGINRGDFTWHNTDNAEKTEIDSLSPEQDSHIPLKGIDLAVGKVNIAVIYSINFATM